jgi:hypothetical protein
MLYIFLLFKEKTDMKRTLLALFLAAVMMLSALPLTAFANTEPTFAIEGDTIVYTKTLNEDGKTYTVTVSDPDGDGVIPNLSTNNLYTTTPWYATDVSTIIFDETITSIGTWTVSSTRHGRDGTCAAPSHSG